jgi:hypothetical protein
MTSRSIRVVLGLTQRFDREKRMRRELRMTQLTLVASALVGVTFVGLAAASPLVDSVTMQARSTVVRGGESGVDLFGTISSGAEGEYVAGTGKECGIPGSSFRAVGGATTTPGGNWEGLAAIVTTTTLRAEWKSAISDTVVIRARAWVGLAKQGAYVLRVGLAASRVDGKRVTIQRLTPAAGSGCRQ